MAHHDDAPSRRRRPGEQGHVRRRARIDRAAMASNWRQVLLVDALFGVIVVLAGGVVAAVLWAAAGGVLVVLGGVYLGFGVARWRRWARLRAEAGLDKVDDDLGDRRPPEA
ncbi:MAG: hypothetical protein ACR2GF_02600 [Acidimicrobiales bacterium]